jgi:predicted neutral ceramidase superfamily lipid hydrolase
MLQPAHVGGLGPVGGADMVAVLTDLYRVQTCVPHSMWVEEDLHSGTSAA